MHFHHELKLILNNSDPFFLSTQTPFSGQCKLPLCVSIVCFSVQQVKSSVMPLPLRFLRRKIYSLWTHLLLHWLACLKCREPQIKCSAFPFWKKADEWALFSWLFVSRDWQSILTGQQIQVWACLAPVPRWSLLEGMPPEIQHAMFCIGGNKVVTMESIALGKQITVLQKPIAVRVN